MKHAKLPLILEEDRYDEAVRRVRDYLEHKFTREARGFNGAYFEKIGNENPDRYTASDLYAVTMLSVKVPASAGIELLMTDNDRATKALQLIPTDIDFTDLAQPGALIESQNGNKYTFDDLLGANGKCLELWKLLFGYYNVGATTASKLMALKRPRLIPIWDSEVGRATGLRTSRNQWVQFRDLFRTPGLVDRLEGIRESAGAEHLPLLRIFDIAVWHHQSAPRRANRKKDPMPDHCAELK